MPRDSITSPRDAIRDWLAHIPKVAGSANAEAICNATRDDDQAQSSHHRRTERELDQTTKGVCSRENDGALEIASLVRGI